MKSINLIIGCICLMLFAGFTSGCGSDDEDSNNSNSIVNSNDGNESNSNENQIVNTENSDLNTENNINSENGDNSENNNVGNSSENQITNIENTNNSNVNNTENTYNEVENNVENSENSNNNGLPDYTESECYGQEKTTNLFNHGQMAFIPINTTCRAEGESTKIYVQNELWESEKVTQDDIDSFMNRFELLGNNSSYNPEQGVIYTNQEVFGELSVTEFPDNKVHLFIVDSDGRGDGYICPTTYGWCDFYCIHLDGALMDLQTDYAMAVASHELFHLIHHYIDSDEHMWVDETLAQTAMTVNGFYTDSNWVRDWLNNTDRNWGPGDPEHGSQHYGAFLTWGLYLWEYGGVDLINAIANEQEDGWLGIDLALEATGEITTSWDLYLDYIVTIGVNNESKHFDFVDIGQLNMKTPLELDTERAESVQPYGIDYHPVRGTGEYNVAINSNKDIYAMIVVYDDSEVRVSENASIQNIIDDSINLPDNFHAFIAITAEETAEYSVTISESN